MRTSELLNKVRLIEIKTRKLVNNLFSGEYSCAFIVNPENIFPQIIPVYLNVLDSDLLPGDINFDEILNILDIVMLVNFVLGSANPDTNQFNSSDLNSKFYQNVVINYEDKEITCDYFDVDMETNIAIVGVGAILMR